MLTGDNGLITKANLAKNASEESTFKEEVELMLLQAKTGDSIATIFKDAEEFQEDGTVYKVTYKGKSFLISKDLEYIPIIEPEKLSDWTYTNAGTITAYNGTDKDITIPNYINGVRIKALGDKVFENKKDIDNVKISEGIEIVDGFGYDWRVPCLIKSVSIPNTCITIGDGAFMYCSNLVDVTFGNNIETIGIYAFFRNTNLKGPLKLPKTLKIIKADAFVNCGNLEGKLDLPNSLEYIGARAFSGCRKITGSVKIPEAMTIIYENTFQYCESLDGTLTIHDNVTEIQGGAFSECKKLKGELKLPKNLKILGSNFNYCYGFDGNITIPEGVTQIEAYSFYGCNYTGVLKIPNSVTTIANSAFINNNFSKVIIDNTEENGPKVYKSTNQEYSNIEYLR